MNEYPDVDLDVETRDLAGIFLRSGRGIRVTKEGPVVTLDAMYEPEVVSVISDPATHESGDSIVWTEATHADWQGFDEDYPGYITLRPGHYVAVAEATPDADNDSWTWVGVSVGFTSDEQIVPPDVVAFAAHDPVVAVGGVTATGVFSAWQDSQMTLTVKVWHDGTDLDVGAKLYVARL